MKLILKHSDILENFQMLELEKLEWYHFKDVVSKQIEKATEVLLIDDTGKILKIFKDKFTRYYEGSVI